MPRCTLRRGVTNEKLVEPRNMSFEVLDPKMKIKVGFALIFLGEILGDRIQVWTPLYKLQGNASTRLFPVSEGSGFDSWNEYSCDRVHNLTMTGYAKETVEDFFKSDYETNDFLRRLEKKLQYQIDERIKGLGRSREERTYHIAFPSLEGALVSISLLLFAVYLIKLVMKVVYTFNAKNGATEYVGFLSNLRQPIVIAPNRHKRSFELDMETFKINNIVHEQYNLFH